MNNLYEKLRSENDNHFYSFIFGDFDFKNITKKIYILLEVVI